MGFFKRQTCADMSYVAEAEKDRGGGEGKDYPGYSREYLWILGRVETSVSKTTDQEREGGVADYVGSNLQLFIRFWTLVCCDELIVSELSREDPF